MPMAKKISAGILLFRVRDHAVEVFLVHPGGPYWARKDDGAWSIPKGETEDGADLLATARTEFHEETGSHLAGPTDTADTAQAGRRQGCSCVGGARRHRRHIDSQQYVRDRMAAPVGQDARISRSRPSRMVRSCDRAAKAAVGTARIPRSAARSLASIWWRPRTTARRCRGLPGLTATQWPTRKNDETTTGLSSRVQRPQSRAIATGVESVNEFYGARDTAPPEAKSLIP